jgi:D-alanyl-D-alanine carboxypeptidase
MRTIGALVLVLVLAGCGSTAATQKPRPGFERTLHSLVAGPNRIAPGATAYVAGPHGVWSGAAGWANVGKRIRMTPDAPLRLESVSKLWTAVVIMKLVDEGKLGLDDTVDKWLPGFFPYGKRITIHELLTHTSGMVDDNDWNNDGAYWFAKVHDPRLRAAILRIATAREKDPTVQFSPLLEMRFAAAIPLLSEPGTRYHYSNVGYITAGVIAAKAAHEPLDALYRRIIIEPLDLTSAVYAPGDRWPGDHPLGYSVRKGGRLIEATDWWSGALAAQGGIVANARDEARFLTALMQGKVLSARSLRKLETPNSADGIYALGVGRDTVCGRIAFAHNGGGIAYSSSVYVSEHGSHVAVLLLNGRTNDSSGDSVYPAAAAKLFCLA